MYASVQPLDVEAATPAAEKSSSRRRRGVLIWGLAVAAWCVAGVGFYRVAAWRRRPSGLLLFDDFDGDAVDEGVWTVERSLDSGGNGEFQAYTDDPDVIAVRDGKLVIQPRPMTSEHWKWLTRGIAPKDVRAALADGSSLKVARCTADDAPGLCEHASKWDEPLPPVVSAKLTTRDKFSFRYGTAEIRLRVPVGDWIWPAIWMLPADDAYGPWPLSGEIDLLEARGNNESYRVEGSDQSGFAGVDRIAATVHCADSQGGDDFSIGNTTIHGLEDDEGFITIGMEWRRDALITYARETNGARRVLATSRGPACANDVYRGGSPFDRDFYLIINVAVGGSAGGAVPYWGSEVFWRDCDHPHFCDPRTLFADRAAAWLPTWTRPLEVDWLRVTRD